MSIENFEILNNEPIDSSIMKKDFSKTYHQQGATLNDLDQNSQFVFLEFNIYHQIGNA